MGSSLPSGSSMSEERYLSGLPLAFATIGVALATFMIVLDYSIANVAIPYIAGDLAVSVDQGTYVITSFAVGNAIFLPLTGWLTKRIGMVRLLLLSVLLFIVFSWFCAISWNFVVLIGSRFVQGCVSGPLIPLSQTLLLRINPPEKRNAAISFWATVVIIAPIFGPIIGGWLTYNYTWPWIFYINIPIGILSLFLAHLFLRDYETTRQKLALDWLGLILLAIGVAALQVLLDKGEQYNWLGSPLIRSLALVSFFCLSLLVLWELAHPFPFLNLRLLKITSYATSIVFITVAYAIYFGSVVLTPLWLQTRMGYTAEVAGLAMAPIGLMPLLFSTLMGRIVTRFGKILPLAGSFFLLSLACLYTSTLATNVDFFRIALSRFYFGCGLAFFFVPLTALSVQDMPASELPNATGFFHFVRAMVGGMGTSLFTTLWVRRTIFHHQRLGSTVTPYSQNTTDFLSLLKQRWLSEREALGVTNAVLDNQAAMMGIDDCFYLMGWAFLALILLLALGRGRRVRSA